MKKSFSAVIALLTVIATLCTTCAKVNTDQPCGNYNGTNQLLFKDGNGNCYYIQDTDGKHIYVTNSTCNC